MACGCVRERLNSVSEWGRTQIHHLARDGGRSLQSFLQRCRHGPTDHRWAYCFDSHDLIFVSHGTRGRPYFRASPKQRSRPGRSRTSGASVNSIIQSRLDPGARITSNAACTPRCSRASCHTVTTEMKFGMLSTMEGAPRGVAIWCAMSPARMTSAGRRQVEYTDVFDELSELAEATRPVAQSLTGSRQWA